MVCDRGIHLVITSLTLTCTAFVVVAFRLYVRIAMLHTFGWDDWSLVTALAFTMVMTSAMIGQAHYGVGEHVEHLRPQDSQNILYWFYIGSIFYTVALGLAKISLLLQYMELFRRPCMRIACFIGLLWVFSLTVETTIISIFDCWPLPYFWDKSVPSGTCVNFRKMWSYHSTLNVVSDFYLIFLPLPFLATSEAPKSQLYATAFAFLLGIFVCIASMIRSVYVEIRVLPKSVAYDSLGGAIWTCAQLCSTVIVASLPAYKWVVARAVQSFRRRLSSSRETQYRESMAHLEDPVEVRHPAPYRPENFYPYRPEPERAREARQENRTTQSMPLQESHPATDGSLSGTTAAEEV